MEMNTTEQRSTIQIGDVTAYVERRLETYVRINIVENQW